MKLIGITSSSTENRSFVNKAYVNAFTRPGYVPVILPQFPIESRETITQEQFEDINSDHIAGLVNSLDALVVSGGQDINPSTFNDNLYGAASCDGERDMMELALINGFVIAKKPIMGICRGMQMLGQFIGMGYYFQQHLGNCNEIHSGSDRDFKDRQEVCHSVQLLGSLKNYMADKLASPDINSLKVNSWHHQGFTYTYDGKPPSKADLRQYEQKGNRDGGYGNWMIAIIKSIQEEYGVNVLASTKLVIEAFEKIDAPIYAVQWHPEEYGNKGYTIQYFLDKYVPLN